MLPSPTQTSPIGTPRATPSKPLDNSRGRGLSKLRVGSRLNPEMAPELSQAYENDSSLAAEQQSTLLSTGEPQRTPSPRALQEALQGLQRCVSDLAGKRMGAQAALPGSNCLAS